MHLKEVYTYGLNVAPVLPCLIGRRQSPWTDGINVKGRQKSKCDQYSGVWYESTWLYLIPCRDTAERGKGCVSELPPKFPYRVLYVRTREAPEGMRT
jgi:hypothetical protein